MDDFTKAKPRDRVYSLTYGEGFIESIRESGRVTVSFPDYLSIGKEAEFHHDGRLLRNAITPDLYWSKPEIIAPPMPPRTRKVKREIVRYINIYPDEPSSQYIHLTEEIAESRSEHGAIAVAVPMRGEYEVEEEV